MKTQKLNNDEKLSPTNELRTFAKHLIIVGGRLERLRKKRRKTLSVVAKETGLSTKQLMFIEAGMMSDFTLVALWSLTDYYRADFKEIYFD